MKYAEDGAVSLLKGYHTLHGSMLFAALKKNETVCLSGRPQRNPHPLHCTTAHEHSAGLESGRNILSHTTSWELLLELRH